MVPTRTNGPVRVLCLDPDGGRGGSSKSLFHLLEACDRDRVQPEVWCRRDYGLIDAYRSLGIESRLVPTMPKVSPLPRMSRDLIDHGSFLLGCLRMRPFFRRIQRAEEGFDLIHLNHENLTLTGAILRRSLSIPMTAHVRTMVWDYATLSARQHARILSRFADGAIFISENERRAFHRFAALKNEAVILNPAPFLQSADIPSAPKCGSRPFRVLCVSNFSWFRGTDRMVAIAAAIRKIDPSANIEVRIVGEKKITSGETELLRKIAEKRGTLDDLAEAFDVSGMVSCPGHTDNIAHELRAADVLVKPTRENNPWGRDIIEAMAHCLPVVSIGHDPLFVESGATGLLMETFDETELARTLIDWSRNHDIPRALGMAANARVRRLCDPKMQAKKTVEFWNETRRAREGAFT